MQPDVVPCRGANFYWRWEPSFCPHRPLLRTPVPCSAPTRRLRGVTGRNSSVPSATRPVWRSWRPWRPGPYAGCGRSARTALTTFMPRGPEQRRRTVAPSQPPTAITYSTHAASASGEKNGAPGGIRTPDHLVRSQVLYPTELRARSLARILLHPLRPEGLLLPRPGSGLAKVAAAQNPRGTMTAVTSLVNPHRGARESRPYSHM
jgi:hypothetical protein